MATTPDALAEKLKTKSRIAVAKVGRQVTIVAADPTLDIVTSLPTNSATKSYSVLATPLCEYRAALVNGDTILHGDCYIVVPSDGCPVTPVAKAMSVVADGRTMKIESVTTHSVGKTVVAWELQLRAS